MPENAKEKLEQFLIGIGATAELLGALRDSLMTSGRFTREEAVGMCTELFLALLTSGLDLGGN